MMNVEMPGAFGASGKRANTRWMMLSASVVGSPLEMKNFGAGDGVGAVGVRNRFGAQNAEVSTAVRFGQTHRPISPGHQFWQVRGFHPSERVRKHSYCAVTRPVHIHASWRSSTFRTRIGVHGEIGRSVTAVFRIA